jgi:methylmalonyl-CoA mutase
VSVTTEVPTALAAWHELAEPGLRKVGKSLATLSTTTDDGFTIAPLYVDGPTTPDVNPTADPWDVRQYHGPGSDLAEEINGGTTSLWLPSEQGDATRAVVESGLGVVLDAGAETEQAADDLFRLLRHARTPLRGNLGADPLGLAARTGAEPRIDLLPRLVRRCVNEHPPLRAITVDAAAHHDAGAPDALELAYALATGVAYLRVLIDAGLSLRTALDQLEFRYAVGCDQWPAIAKLRAAQLLWARVARAAGVTAPVRQRRHAVTSRTMMTARAPWTNIIRSTVAAFAAVVGGADAITILPHDLCRGPATPEARRLARNTHALLRLEVDACRVQDPAAGSWYAEQLTRGLATEAWARFRDIERNGGMAASLADGAVRTELAAARQRRRDDVRALRRPIVGVTAYPSLDEEPPSEITPGHAAEEFEQLRRRAEAGPLKPVALVLLDSPDAAADAAETDRTLQLAGVRTVRGTAEIAFLCGLDAAAPAHAEQTAERLRRSGTSLWALTAPSATVPLDGRLHRGGDAVAALDLLLDHLGAPR